MAQLTSTATATGKTGGGPSTVTALALTAVTQMNFNIAAGVLTVHWGTPARISYFDLTQTTTVTDTISGTTHTFVVS